MEDHKWKLGDDLSGEDNLLDPVTFESLILSVHCGCQVIDRKSVKKTMDEIIEDRLADARFLLERNMEAIIKAAMKGRGDYEG